MDNGRCNKHSIIKNLKSQLEYDIFFRENINVNDALGGYSLTLIDTLDTLAVSIYPFSDVSDLQYFSPNSSYTYYLI